MLESNTYNELNQCFRLKMMHFLSDAYKSLNSRWNPYQRVSDACRSAVAALYFNSEVWQRDLIQEEQRKKENRS